MLVTTKEGFETSLDARIVRVLLEPIFEESAAQVDGAALLVLTSQVLTEVFSRAHVHFLLRILKTLHSQVIILTLTGA